VSKGAPARILTGGAAAIALAVLAGCATQALNSARRDFYQGHFDQASTALERKLPKQDRVLFLMERGTVRLFSGDYENSARDFVAAYDRLTELETYSLSKGGASLLVNDSIQDFRGFPYERTLLHAFTALDHLALSNWEHAAVEARRLLDSLSPEKLGDYPDDAYSRYLAGFCLELIGDSSNARLQYEKAAALASQVNLDPNTGRFGSSSSASSNAAAELVCFVMMGRAPAPENMLYPDSGLYAEIYSGNTLLGRSQPLTDVADLASTSYQKDAAREVAKTVTRIAVKETIAYQIEKDNEALGALARIILIGLLERPDTRRWETLPRYLEVARVPCPPDLTEFTISFRTGNGQEISRRTIAAPLTRQGSTFVSFVRDIPR